MKDFREELDRIRRVSDMLTTGHADLKERFRRRALFLDISILAISLWLTAIVFVEPHLNFKLTPFKMDPQLWVGLLGVFCFFLSIVQLRVDWKGRADAHKRAYDLYAEVKRECGYLLASEDQVTEEKSRRVQARYDMATEVGVPLPEKEFLPQKRRHLQKIAISKHLDNHPGASVLLLRFKMWWKDNISQSKGN
jgi:hypothetical protein